jgi:ssDNA-binding Zn-finger/Zn-ribbon topoisomerase 1
VSKSEDTKDSVAMLGKAIKAIRADAADRKRSQGVVVCPKCGGELGYSISGYNGHIHGRCNTTRGCLAWMM